MNAKYIIKRYWISFLFFLFTCEIFHSCYLGEKTAGFAFPFSLR